MFDFHELDAIILKKKKRLEVFHFVYNESIKDESVHTFNYRICTCIFDSRLCTGHVNYYIYNIDVCRFFFFQSVSLFSKSDTFQSWGPSCPHPIALSYYCAFICECFSGTGPHIFQCITDVKEESNFRQFNRAISASLFFPTQLLTKDLAESWVYGSGNSVKLKKHVRPLKTFAQFRSMSNFLHAAILCLFLPCWVCRFLKMDIRVDGL